MLAIREVIKTFYNALLQRLKKYRGNWEQNDPTADDYIKNRPFYTDEINKETVVAKTTFTTTESNEQCRPFFFKPVVGQVYIVTWNKKLYECVAYEFNEVIWVGNISIGGEGKDTGEPFLYGYRDSSHYALCVRSPSTHTIEVSCAKVVKLDEKYLPESIATKSEVEAAKNITNTANYTANAAKTAAENAQSTANAAKTAAENAQSTANAAQSTANAAQSTANAAQSKAESIKPNWNENNSSKPGYIANRPFYHDIITAEIPGGKRRTPSAELLIDGTELYWSGLVSNLTGLLKIDGNKIYMLDGTLEKFTPISFRTGVNSYSYDYALGNPHLIKAKLPSAKDAHGGELPDTGGNWVYYHTPGRSTVVTISKINRWYGTFVEFLSEDLKLLDEKFIPASIQRTGGEVFLHSSTADSTKKFRITVDDSGKPTFTNSSDSANSYTPTDLPSVTSSDSGKFLRVSSAGEWVAETIPNASGVSF